MKGFVEAAVVPNEALAGLVGEVLTDEGIAHEMALAYDTLPGFGVRVGTPVRVMVGGDDLEFARALVEDVLTRGDVVDWDEVDVGEAEDDVAARVGSREIEPWDAGVERARALRRWGWMLVAVGVGCGFAFFGYDVVLFVVLAVCAVWLGRAHAITRQRRKVERRYAEMLEE